MSGTPDWAIASRKMDWWAVEGWVCETILFETLRYNGGNGGFHIRTNCFVWFFENQISTRLLLPRHIDGNVSQRSLARGNSRDFVFTWHGRE